MTAGGEKIQRYYVDRENVTPSHYGMGEDSRGEYVLYADAHAWVIAELKALAKEMCPYCMELNELLPAHKDGSFAHKREAPAGPYYYPHCYAPQIHARIAELEKEGK